jgi:predicted O-methyltransferase YrrM
MTTKRPILLRLASRLRDRIVEPVRINLLARQEPARTRRLFPALPADPHLMRRIAAEYRAEYDIYVREVSSPRAAASLETLALIVAIMRSRPIRRVADLGSGFSTFVIRREAERIGAYHVAVDDNSGWLEKTREFLTARGMSSSNLVSWNDFCADPRHRDYDLVLHDLGGSELRRSAMPEVEARVAQMGWLVLDDMHKTHLYPRMNEFMRPRWHVVPLVGLTRDQFGRFCAVCRRRGADQE